MRRVVACLTLALITTTGLAGPSSAAEGGSSVSVTDHRHDVSKNFAPHRKRDADLDIRGVSARLGDDMLTLRLRFEDLRKKHTRDVEEGGMHHVWAMMAITLKFGKKREFLSYGLHGEPHTSTTSGRSAFDDCFDEAGTTFLLDQHADYARDLMTITVPIYCLPEKHDSFRTSGYVYWDNPQGVLMSDHITKARYSLRTKWTAALSYA